MRKITKRVFTVLLTLIMLSTALPLGVFAMETQTDAETFAETDVSGTNSAGNILAETITEAQEDAEEKAAAPAGISALTLNGFTAEVEFFTDRDAKLVVAIYTEDGKQMLASGVSDVTAEDTTATVQINSITLPQYYLVKAFLLDAATNASLFGYFTDDTHTEAYKDFMALETDDFDEDKVINLDASEDNNFLVVSDEAQTINGTASVNTLTSADYEAGKYVFKNIDSAIRSLKAGDVFYYTSTDGKYEIIKVKSISISGSTATIVSDTMEMEEAFEVIKIDTSKSEYAVQQNNNGDYFETSAVEYNENVTILKGEFEVKLGKDDKGKIKPQITKKELQTGVAENDEIDEEDKSLEFVAKLNAKAEFSAKLVIYLSESYEKIEFTLDGNAAVKIDIGLEFEKEFDIGKFNFKLFAVINFGVKLAVKIEAKIIAEISGTVTFKYGFKKIDEHSEKILEKPSFKPEVKLEGEFYFGILLTPYVNVIDEQLIYISFPISIGARIHAELSTEVATDDDHDCNACIEGNIKIEIKGSPTVKVASIWKPGGHVWKMEDLINITIDVTDFYYSITHNQFGFGTCPYAKKVINIGEKIKLGTYNGEPITWICVAINENGPLMLAEDILFYKAFDAKGTNSTYHIDGWGYIRERYGSNCWQDSNIRQWLNSDEETVSWTHCPPSSGNVTANPYNNESGFLTNFTDSEKSMIKSVTRVVNVNDYEAKRSGYCDGGSTDITLNAFTMSSLNAKSYCYKNVTDSVFLLNAEEWNSVYNSNKEYLKASSEYLLGSSVTNGGACFEWVATSTTSATMSHRNAYEGTYGIRPAFYLDGYTTSATKNSEYLETETLETQSTEAVEVIAGTETGFTVNTCVANGRYTLLNVTGYGESFELTVDNLLYIDVLNADSYGNLTVDFTPMRDDETATTLLIGDFGNGVEAIKPGNIKSSITNVTYEPSREYKNTFTVTAEGRPMKIQFIEPYGGTRTYDRNHKNVTIKSYDENGNEVTSLDRALSYEVWEICSNMAVGVEIKTKAKCFNGTSTEWEDMTYNFTVEFLPLDTSVRSITPAATSGPLGGIETKVVTGPDVQGIRFVMPNETTCTYYSSGAAVLDNGDLEFTGRFWIGDLGLNVVKVLVRSENKWTEVDTIEYIAE